MGRYRNIDKLVRDGAISITISPSSSTFDYSGIPVVGDSVTLDLGENYPMIVEITEVLSNRDVFRGTVAHGYYPNDEKEWIREGEFVEFSKSKIGSIHKK